MYFFGKRYPMDGMFAAVFTCTLDIFEVLTWQEFTCFAISVKIYHFRFTLSASAVDGPILLSRPFLDDGNSVGEDGHCARHTFIPRLVLRRSRGEVDCSSVANSREWQHQSNNSLIESIIPRQSTLSSLSARAAPSLHGRRTRRSSLVVPKE